MQILQNKPLMIFTTLFLMMAATRSHHFSSALHLPDASLAVFFLAGFFIQRILALPILLLTAGAIDYLSITLGNTSGWCISSAYWFLIPTYALLWFGGRWYASKHALRLKSIITLNATLFVSTTVAFVISNGSFYTISGRYTDPNWTEYLESFAMYYPSYLSSAFIYVGAITVIYIILKATPVFSTRKKSSNE